MTDEPRRSALFLPASNARAIEKARSVAADVVILDLEDAVAPDAKPSARDQAAAAIAAGGFGRRSVVLRINGRGTAWVDGDLRVARDAGADAVLLPKVGSPEDLAWARGELGADGPPLWAMIETCGAILDIGAIVGAAGDVGLEALVAGTNDLAKEMRCRPGTDRAPLGPALAAIVMAARSAGLLAFDGVCNAIDDADRLAGECEQGLRWGFDGKSLIHPSQIATANRIFTPTMEEVQWAKAVVAAFADPDNGGKGAIRVNGAMTELLHLTQARRVLAIVNGLDELERVKGIEPSS